LCALYGEGTENARSDKVESCSYDLCLCLLENFFLHFVANSRNTWQHKTTEDLAAAEKEFEDLQPYELPKAEMVDLVQ